MRKGQHAKWQKLTVTPEEVMAKLEPGMSIFLGTGVGEPRTLVKHLMADHSSNLKDLELIQLVSLGDAISVDALNSNAYRLKTFYSGWVASEAITAGRVDLIPSCFSRIPRLIESGRIPIDVAFVQITPPNEAGYCSLGVAVDVGRQAMEKASLVEFQGIDKVFTPAQIGENPRFMAVLPARKADISGRIALHFGKGNVTAGPGDVMDLFHGAELSRGGMTIFGLPSRNRNQESNIVISVEEFPNQFSIRESIDMVITEYGVASLSGRTVRERAQALIEIAHPDDRAGLVEQAKEEKILYPDQIFIKESAHLYPAEINLQVTFKGDKKVRFRAIRPSDEEEMRRLFYRFSDQSVY